MNPDTSPAGVTSTERYVELNGKRVRIGRQEYEGWDDPSFAFNMDERLSEALGDSQIRAFDACFRAGFPGYRLVDYGALDGRELEKAEKEGQA